LCLELRGITIRLSCIIRTFSVPGLFGAGTAILEQETITAEGWGRSFAVVLRILGLYNIYCRYGRGSLNLLLLPTVRQNVALSARTVVELSRAALERVRTFFFNPTMPLLIANEVPVALSARSK
jgi:hypothetical protein